MKNYLAVESATGDMYQLFAQDATAAYRTLAREVLKIPDADEPDFNVGNVNFDLYLLLPPEKLVYHKEQMTLSKVKKLR